MSNPSHTFNNSPIYWSRIIFRLLLAGVLGTIAVSLLVFLRESSVLQPAATVAAVTILHYLGRSTASQRSASNLAVAYDELLRHYPAVEVWLGRGSKALTLIQGFGWGLVVSVAIWLAGAAMTPAFGAGTAGFLATVGIMGAFYSVRGLRKAAQDGTSPLVAAILKAYPSAEPYLNRRGPGVVVARSFIRALGVQILRAAIVWIAAGLTSPWLGCAAVGFLVLLVTTPELVRGAASRLKVTPTEQPADTTDI
jgi:hypothetical protein